MAEAGATSVTKLAAARTRKGVMVVCGPAGHPPLDKSTGLLTIVSRT
jgi:hypothetical protein